ncbi:MAG: hypothetical protein WDN76_05015 [Alphaproteobacteria bacterium]
MIPRDYVSHGFRSAARDAATERLGERTRQDGREALDRETRAHRVTSLDRMIENQLDANGRISIAHLHAPNRSPEVTDALKARAHELKRLGLANEIRRNVLSFAPDWENSLTAMEQHLDIRKSLMRVRAQDLARGVDAARSISKGPRTPPGLDR